MWIINGDFGKVRWQGRKSSIFCEEVGRVEVEECNELACFEDVRRLLQPI